jgi:hypothetical protein
MSAGRRGCFASNSCTLFSPNILWPALYASIILSAGWVFDTATSVTWPGNPDLILVKLSAMLKLQFFNP